MVSNWIAENIVEIFGAVTGIAYVILEIKRNILLWPLGIITSAVYIYVFGRNGFYANMGLQGYYLVISFYGWYAWQRSLKERSDAVPQSARVQDEELTAQGAKGAKRGSFAKGEGTELQAQSAVLRAKGPESGTDIMRIGMKTAILCLVTALVLWGLLWFVLDRWTDSPVPVWDGLIASMSVVATWMLTRKYLEQWYVWIVANAIAVVVYLAVGMYPTAVLFFVYFGMAIIGLKVWSKKELRIKNFADLKTLDFK